MEIRASAAAWHALPSDVRLTLKVNYPRRPVSIEDASAAVAWARYRLRLLTVPARLAFAPLAGVLIWLLARELLGPVTHVSHPRVIVSVVAISAVIWFALVIALVVARRLEVAHLASALAGVGVVWTVRDAAAAAGEGPRHRRLERWITSNGGRIVLSTSQMRESPEAVYLASERFRAAAARSE